MTFTDRVGRPYKAALARYDRRRDPVDHQIDLVLPEDFGKVHATASWTTKRMRSKEPIFLSSLDYGPTGCGAPAKVILAIDFDPGDPDACQSCAAAVINQTTLKYHNQHEHE